MLVFAVFTLLQTRYAPKRPVPAVAATDSSLVAAPADTNTPGTPAVVPPSSAANLGTSAPPAPVEARTIVVETALYRATFSNLGARLVSVELKHYASAHGRSQYSEFPGRRPKQGEEVPEGDRVVLGGEPSFGIDVGSGANRRSLANTAFAVSESADASGAVRAITFTTQDSGGIALRQTWRVRADSYLLDLEVQASGQPASGELSLTARSWPLVSEDNPNGEVNSLRAIAYVDKDLHRDGASGLVGKSAKVYLGDGHWAGVQSHYFLGLVAPVAGGARGAINSAESRTLTPAQLALLPKDTKPAQPVALGTLVAPAAGATQRYVVYFGPADYFSLAKLSGAGKLGSLRLEKAVDLGFAWLLPFSYPLLQLLRWLYGLVHNYGIAIFLLATVVRLVLHPLNMTSMKSMRAMTRLQPEIERLREKYKNNAQALNTAMMALYRENGVNPAGGCLPMVLQMPLFFALYAVLSNAFDLRMAPFVGWIHDLSAPDRLTTIGPLPIRLLPIIMAATGFLQQKLTPTPAQQAATMYMMNAFMLFVFYNLPSGLVFYWTVMNLYTALQQWMAQRGDGGVVVVVPGESGSGRPNKKK